LPASRRRISRSNRMPIEADAETGADHRDPEISAVIVMVAPK
jgi:hypothetical protein